jgi:hypothetical protein
VSKDLDIPHIASSYELFISSFLDNIHILIDLNLILLYV